MAIVVAVAVAAGVVVTSVAVAEGVKSGTVVTVA